MKMSLIIPTYNRGEALADTLTFALSQSYPDYEVLVIDQTHRHAPSAERRLQPLLKQVCYMRLSKPNLPAARNLGLKSASGDIVVFIDDDVIIGRDYVGSLAGHFGKPDVGAVMGLTRSPGENASEAGLAGALRTYHARGEGRLGDVFEVGWVCGGNAAWRKAAVVEAGGFDEYFTGTALCEDAEMAVRLRRNGWRLLLDSRIDMVHLAIPCGGCGSRNLTARRRQAEELRFYSYFLLKHVRFLGPWAVSDALARKYKTHLRAAFAGEGVGVFMLQWLFIGNLIRACFALGTRRRGGSALVESHTLGHVNQGL